MKKRNFWPLLFIGIFSFTFGMIIWTIVSAVNTPVHEDKSFLGSYQNIDAQYNDIVASNEKFKKDYKIEIKLNNSTFSLDTNDIYLSQRVIEEKPPHKDFFYVGDNSIEFKITNIKTALEEKAKVNFKVTKATNNNFDIDISNSDSNEMNFNFNLLNGGNWNITGTIETNDGSNKGYFFIKSNAINR